MVELGYERKNSLRVQLVEIIAEQSQYKINIKKSLSKLRVCLKAGADVDFCLREEKMPHLTVLQIACRDGNPEIVKLILKHTKNVNKTHDDRKITPLMLAAFNGNVGAVALLLAAGADPTLKNDEGMTAAELALRPPEGLTVGEGHRACQRLLAGAAAVKALEAELG